MKELTGDIEIKAPCGDDTWKESLAPEMEGGCRLGSLQFSFFSADSNTVQPIEDAGQRTKIRRVAYEGLL